MQRYKLLISVIFSVGLLLNLYSQTEVPVYLDEGKPIKDRIEDALSRMTLEEKVAMCHAQSKFSTPGCPRLGIPEIWMSDGPHGVRMEFDWDDWLHAGWTNDSCTAYPALTCLAATFNPDLAYRYGYSLGEEARFRKKDIILGPGVNIYRTPLSGRNFEYMGEDPYLTSAMVVPYIQGVQKNGVAACMKHFVLNNQEKWRDTINVVVSDRALNEIYFPAFKAGVQKGNVWAVMGAYNKYKNQYCSHNEILINKILKTDWGFDGVMVTDWGSAHNTDEAARYGLDLEMGSWTNGLTWGVSSAYDNYYLATPFLDKIRSGELPESLVDEKVRRILLLNFRTNMDRSRTYGRKLTTEHKSLAIRVAEEGIVLLKNENNFFPILEGKYKKIAVIGENAIKKLTQGGGSSELKPKEEVSPLQGIINRYGTENVVYSMGYASGAPDYNNVLPSPFDADSLLHAAVEVARSADVVIFIGGLNKNKHQDCEGDDRLNMDLPFGQDKLIGELLKVNKNTGVIIVSGNAVSMPWLDKVDGVMQSWYLGSEAGTATANIISGNTNPSGKLPFSIPKKLEDNSAHYLGEKSYPGDGTNQYYLDDILVGYRWHDTKKIAPLFPFGYGLSYTTFEYGKISTDKKKYSEYESVRVSFTLTNKGKVDGAESVQLYMSQKSPSAMRPAKELKGFDKVFLKAGETKVVNMTVEVKDFAFYDEKTGSWVVENDDFILHNAASSGDVKSSITIKILN
ncbi:glycoside hydrolase family 3 C-terminal domain-containing protein [Dysgonomonas sp. 520]|uniref:glycoside hydrolase family 3 C-terminal domain-containing protein n=1 Tax=Dysgonomonas sp. 520 TaxID=2302931 RepID=UPI0013D7D872|nr:glycoside hydrolase family 3 C-terminal domain-containing protein [Dysgonomonas sp. 520]NDW10172.1 glycosyl hydrolase [Dysgonomonas sp. 520]